MIKAAPILVLFFFLHLSFSYAGPILAVHSYRQSQHESFLNWVVHKEIEIRNRPIPSDQETIFNEPIYLPLQNIPIEPENPFQARRTRSTTDLYFRLFGKNTLQSFLWTGIESGNPLTRNEEYRWNSLRDAGMYDPVSRHKIIEGIKAAGVRNVRLGISNHEVDLADDSTWSETTAMIDDFYAGGMNISLDLHHFGIEDRFRVSDHEGQTDGSNSYYLNRGWPNYFAKFARKAIEKYHRKIKAVTIINEPETVAGFNGEMWHGGFPGWGSGQTNMFYIQRSLQVARASVLARFEIEDFLSTLPPRERTSLIYLHTEASVHKSYWNDFNLYQRFIISDLILGQDWLLNANLKWLAKVPMNQIVGRWHRLNDKTRTELDWVLENYIVYNQQPQNREEKRKSLVKELSDLRRAHRSLRKFGKTMKSDTIFAVDYYSHNEDRDDQGVHLNPEPQFYVEQIKAGRRVGLYRILVDYYNHYQLPMMIGESGTPYNYYGSRWTQQILLEAGKAAHQGIPFLGYVQYPAVDTWGWESALSRPRSEALHNPSGIIEPGFQVRPFMGPLKTSLTQQMLDEQVNQFPFK